MVLTVPFEGFTDVVRALPAVKTIYVSARGSQTLVTAADPETGALVRSLAHCSVAEASAKIQAERFSVAEGVWEDQQDASGSHWVAAVAYKSEEDTPGIWVDMYPAKPTTGQVLAEMYEEFRQTGELDEVSMEEFIRLADPNVVVLSPEEQTEFARRSKS